MRIRYILILALLVAAGVFVAGCDSGGSAGDLVASFEKTNTSEFTVDFKDRSRNPGGSIASRSWDFGDGSTGAGANPSHTYSDPGTYSVTLTVEGSDGSTASTSREISTDRVGEQAFDVTIENVAGVFPVTKSGRFGSSPAGAGDQLEFSFTAGPEELPGTGAVLSMATMFIQSNDAFYAFEPGGVPLFEGDGTPVGFDAPANVTEAVGLWDAGTEVDEEPGTSTNQPPRQLQPNTGDDESGSIAQITNLDTDSLLEDPATVDAEPDTIEYPPVSDVVNVTVESEEDPESGGYKFTVTVENVSDESGAEVNGEEILLSPGSYAAHFDQVPGGDPEENPEDDVTYPGFTAGEAASDDIERIAEDGAPEGAGSAPGNHVETLAGLTGVTVPLSPGAYAAHSSDIQPFSLVREAPDGIEEIAEDGLPGTLAETLGGSGAVTDGGTFGDGPLAPAMGSETNSISFTVYASPPDEDFPGDRLSIATMYIQSNDAFYAFDPAGLPLFDDSGTPISGEVTSSVSLYDAKTEQDEEPGVGIFQAPRQYDFDTGPEEGRTVNRIEDTDGDSFLYEDGFDYYQTSNVIRVTVTPQ